MTVQRQVSPAKDLIEQFNDARTPWGIRERGRYETGAETLR
jgi:hypothetical protein